MNTKQQVVERLLGCECENKEKACAKSSHPNDRWSLCLRNKGHKGKHFACGSTQHKIFEW